MRTQVYFSLVLTMVAMMFPAVNGRAQAGKESLAVLPVVATPSLQQATALAGKFLSLNRVTDALDGQLIDRFNATRKFDLVARSDLKHIIDEQGFGGSGNVDAKTAAQIGKLTGAKYLLVATIDDFQDHVETATFEGTGRSATKRVFRISIVAKMYDSTTGNLKESANFQTGNDEFKQIQEDPNYVVKDSELSDEMMVAVARSLSEKIATHMADVIFPAKIIAHHDSEVTINRGDGAGVVLGDLFNVYSVGDEMFDPDTKESLGREETKVGKVKITEVDPKFSKAEILEGQAEAFSVGAIVRKTQ
jgi:curli biogenesis system outer membrane secretion channel CsgG